MKDEAGASTPIAAAGEMEERANPWDEVLR